MSAAVPGACSVSEAVERRRSTRAFLDREVDPRLLREALELAARAPSGGNLQPWRLYLVGGEKLRELKQRATAKPAGDAPEYDIYPPKLGEPYRTERFFVGEQLYAALGIPREDKVGRMRQFLHNFEFFGAPVGLFCFVDRGMGPPQWSDLGMYLQTLMLLLQERGIDSCPQECWAVQHQTVSRFVGAPPEWMLFCGMAIGHADASAPINGFRSRRMALEEFVTFVGAQGA
jgi:nitroreductase